MSYYLDECSLCDHSEPMCGARSPKNQACTREEGHRGGHAACGCTEGHHPIERWLNPPAALSTKREALAQLLARQRPFNPPWVSLAEIERNRFREHADAVLELLK